MELLSTTDYSRFKIGDRKISWAHSERVTDYMAQKNLMPDYPIIVDSSTFEIIDGRYRFLSARSLGLPVTYKLAEVTTIKDAVTAKSLAKKTSYEDMAILNSDSPIYQKLIDLYHKFSGRFTMNFIVMTTEACQFKESFTSVDKTRFAAGNMDDFDEHETKIKLKNIIEVSSVIGLPDFLSYKLCNLCEYEIDFILENKDLIIEDLSRPWIGVDDWNKLTGGEFIKKVRLTGIA